MFNRRKKAPGDDEQVLEPAPDDIAPQERTTCYPQDGQPPPGVVGQPRTTVYRQAVKWNRGGYETIN